MKSDLEMAHSLLVDSYQSAYTAWWMARRDGEDDELAAELGALKDMIRDLCRDLTPDPQ